jgi:hypothetical protein
VDAAARVLVEESHRLYGDKLVSVALSDPPGV